MASYRETDGSLRRDVHAVRCERFKLSANGPPLEKGQTNLGVGRAGECATPLRADHEHLVALRAQLIASTFQRGNNAIDLR